MKAVAKKIARGTPTDWHAFETRPRAFFYGMKQDCFDRTMNLSARMIETMLSPAEIIPVLKIAKIDFMVMGLYGLTGWLKKPRTTEDFDILTPKKHTKKAVGALCRAFPSLKPKDTPVVVRLFEGDEALVDVMKPHHPVFIEALKRTSTGSIAGHKVAVPSLEMALVLKFFSMTSPGRAGDRQFQDAADFMLVVKNNREIDTALLLKLGELCFDGGGKEIVKMVEDVRAGRRLELSGQGRLGTDKRTWHSHSTTTRKSSSSGC